MAGETPITLIGNMVDETPELRFTAAGHAVASFRIASTPRNFDRTANEWRDGETLFLKVTAWRQLAENCAESLTTKGMRVIVQGRLVSRSFETKDHQRRTVLEVEADEVGPSLRSSTAKVTKAGRGGGRAEFEQARSNVPDPWATN